MAALDTLPSEVLEDRYPADLVGTSQLVDRGAAFVGGHELGDLPGLQPMLDLGPASGCRWRRRSIRRTALHTFQVVDQG